MEQVSALVKPSVATCRGCGADYEAAMVGGRMVPTYCPACMARLDGEPLDGERRPWRILEDLDALGLNVQRHGHLTLGPHAGQPATLDILGGAPGVEAVRRFVASVLQAGPWRATEPMYLFGPTGTGKSQAVFSAVRALLEAGVPRGDIVYDRGRAMVIQLQDRYGTGRVDEFSERRRRARVWVYEDAGTEKLTADAFRIFEDILDAREGRASLMTSNYSREDMANRWADQDGWARLRSRLGPWTAVEMGGADLRFRRAG